MSSEDDFSIYCHDCRHDDPLIALAIELDELCAGAENDTRTCAGRACDHAQRGWWWFYIFPIERDE